MELCADPLWGYVEPAMGFCSDLCRVFRASYGVLWGSLCGSVGFLLGFYRDPLWGSVGFPRGFCRDRLGAL